MKETGIRPQVIEEIQKIARDNGVKNVVLFGSRARGDYKRTSDIDLAVFGGDTARFALDIEDTSTLLEYDIVDMGREPQEELQESIRREGMVIYEEI